MNTDEVLLAFAVIVTLVAVIVVIRYRYSTRKSEQDHKDSQWGEQVKQRKNYKQ